MRADRPPATRGRTSSSALRAAYGVSSGDAFAALYLSFLGRLNGPRAGWLLASVDHEFVVQRLRDAAGDVPQRTPAELAEQGPDQ